MSSASAAERLGTTYDQQRGRNCQQKAKKYTVAAENNAMLAAVSHSGDFPRQSESELTL